MSSSPLLDRRHRFTTEEYHQLADAGGLRGQRVELIDGEVIDRVPQNGPHATAVHLVPRVLERAFGPGFYVRAQLPLSLDACSEPEPDVAVVPGSPRDFRDTHPISAILVVEVADTSLAYDLEVKSRLYARAGIGEYWVLDLASRRLHVHRRPGPAPGGEIGYRERLQLEAGDRAILPAIPHAAIAVADLLA